MDPTLALLLRQPVQVLLILSVLVVTLLGWIIPPLQRWMMLIPFRVARGEVHRLVTAGWIHADVGHLGVNMLSLYFFAGQTLQLLGTPRFLVLYLTAVVVASIPSTIRHRKNPGYASLGASGAVAAVMFAAILLHPKLRLTLFFLPVQIPAMGFALLYLLYSFLHALRSREAVNHDAHLSGALYGVLLTYIFEPARVERAIRTLF